MSHCHLEKTFFIPEENIHGVQIVRCLFFPQRNPNMLKITLDLPNGHVNCLWNRQVYWFERILDLL